MSRRTKGLNSREKKLVQNLASQKFPTRKAAALAAGYSESWASHKVGVVLNRPLVKSELTKAMAKVGLTFEKIVQPISDGLQATKTFVHPKFGMRETTFPDHHVRLESVKLAIDLLGGIPKVGESVPSAHGLNLFITVGSGLAPRGPEPKPVNSPPNSLPAKPLLQQPAKPVPSKISLAIQIQPARSNVQGPKKDNGHGQVHRLMIVSKTRTEFREHDKERGTRSRSTRQSGQGSDSRSES